MEQFKRQRDMVERKYSTVGDSIKIEDYMDTQYFIDVEIGTPAQTFEMVPDTGSSNVWVYSSKCNSGPCLYHDTYDADSSLTYKKDGSKFDISYGSGSVSGTVSQDKVALDSSVYAPQMSFGEISTVKGITFYASDMCGIIGLAYQSISVNNLKTFLDETVQTDKSFSMCLKHTSDQSYMTIPGLFENTRQSDYEWHSVIEQKYYSLEFNSVQQKGKKSIDVSKYKAVIDSGTSLLVGPKSIVEEWTQGITVKQNCKGVESLPDLTLTIGGIDYVLTQEDYVVRLDNNGVTECTLGIEGANFGPFYDYFIIGDVFMRAYPTHFDPVSNKVGFLRQAC